MEPLALRRPAARGRGWSVLQTALRTVPQLFGRHMHPLGALCQAEAPEGTAMLAAFSRKHIAQGGPAWGGPALGPRVSSNARVPQSCNEWLTWTPTPRSN